MTNRATAADWRPFLFLFGLAAWQLSTGAAQAKYPAAQLENVPIDRLVKNLESLAEKDPKDARVRFNLARVHGMAFAAKTDAAQVRKGRESEGAWFGYEPVHVPFGELKASHDPAKLKAAKEHLAKAIARYTEVIKLDPNHLPAKLGHAWCLEQSGDKEAAIKAYRQVIEAAWSKEKDEKVASLGARWITTEAASYLKSLLDREKDKDEIKRLDQRAAELNQRPRGITPIVVPLRDGLAISELVDHGARVAFDADGSALPQTWSWISSDAGWLVWDRRSTGRVSSGLELFGSVTYWLFWDNGYQALAALDDDGDGRLAGKELTGLALWQDANRNGMSEPGEVQPLAAYGIVTLSCRYQNDAMHPDVVAFSPQGVWFDNGRCRPTYDVLLHRR